MVTKRHLREENIRLQCRIEALENIVCPGGDHDFYETDRWSETNDGIAFQDLKMLMCKRCGKVVVK